MFCVKIYVSHNTSGFQKNAQKHTILITLHAQKIRNSSQKKYLRENFANFDQQISAFRGNLTRERDLNKDFLSN